MFRVYLRIAVVPMLVLSAALLLIQLQPYDNHELRELLLPDGCSAPCLMGIQPGITTINQAREILKASGWAQNIVLSSGINQTASATFISVSWEWNSNRSPLLDGTYPAYVLSYAQDIHAVVNEIYVATIIPTGTVNLLLQSPKRYSFNTFMPNPSIIASRPFYISLGYDTIQSRTYLGCPMKMSNLWKVKTDLHFYSQAPANTPYTRTWDTRGVIQVLKSLCP